MAHQWDKPTSPKSYPDWAQPFAPPLNGMIWKEYPMGGGQWIMPQPVKLMQSDIDAIAQAVVRLLKEQSE